MLIIANHMKLILVLLLTLFAACNQAPPTLATTVKPESVAEQNLTDSLILTLIFGKAERTVPKNDFERRNGHFFATVALDSAQFSPKHWEAYDRRGSTEYFVELKEEITEDSIEKVLVVLCAEGTSCHACPGLCGAAIFSKTKDQWKLEAWENDIAVIGTTGYPVDQVDVRYVKEGAFAIILKRGSIWQGVSFRGMDMVLYEKGTFKEVLEDNICFSCDNWANAENDYPHNLIQGAFSYTSSLEFQPGKSEYQDLVLFYQGTIPNKKTRKPEFLDKAVRFAYRNGMYVVIKEEIPEAYPN
jgi:hypothetical protein